MMTREEKAKWIDEDIELVKRNHNEYYKNCHPAFIQPNWLLMSLQQTKKMNEIMMKIESNTKKKQRSFF
jgi:hypothetical protein